MRGVTLHAQQLPALQRACKHALYRCRTTSRVLVLLQPDAVSDAWDVCVGPQDAIDAQRFLLAPSSEARLRRLRDALHVAADVAEALRFLHSLDVVHGRLTPSAPRAWSQPLLAAAAAFEGWCGWSSCTCSALLPTAACARRLLLVHGRLALTLTPPPPPKQKNREELRASCSALAERVHGRVEPELPVRCWQRRPGRLRPMRGASPAEPWA